MFYGVFSGGSTTAMTLNMVSFGGFCEGVIRRFEPRYALTSAKSTIQAEKTLFILRNGNLFNNVFNCGEILLTNLSVAVDGTQASTIKIYLNNAGSTAYGTTNTDYANYAYVDQNNSIALLDTTNGTITNGLLIYSFTVGKSESFRFDFSNYNIFLAPGDEVSLTVASSSNTNVNVSLSWVEIQ